MKLLDVGQLEVTLGLICINHTFTNKELSPKRFSGLERPAHLFTLRLICRMLIVHWDVSTSPCQNKYDQNNDAGSFYRRDRAP